MGRSSEEVFDSCSPSGKKLALLLKDKDGKHRGKRKKGRGSNEGGDASLMRMVRKKLSEGLSLPWWLLVTSPIVSHKDHLLELS